MELPEYNADWVDLGPRSSLAPSPEMIQDTNPLLWGNINFATKVSSFHSMCVSLWQYGEWTCRKARCLPYWASWGLEARWSPLCSPWAKGVFIFFKWLGGKKKNTLWCENHMKFKSSCSHVRFHWAMITFTTYYLWLLLCSSGEGRGDNDDKAVLPPELSTLTVVLYGKFADLWSWASALQQALSFANVTYTWFSRDPEGVGLFSL